MKPRLLIYMLFYSCNFVAYKEAETYMQVKKMITHMSFKLASSGKTCIQENMASTDQCSNSYNTLNIKKCLIPTHLMNSPFSGI